MSYSRLRLWRSLKESRRTQEIRLALSRRSCNDVRPWNMPAGSSVIRFPYKILLREKEREGVGTWQQNLCQWKSALRFWPVFYRLGQMESDAGNAFESKDKRYLKREKERKGDRRRTSKLTAMLAISIRERRRRRWSWSGCCSSPCTTWPFREGAHAHKEKCGEFDSYK